MRYHLTSVKMAIIKKTRQVSVRVWRTLYTVDGKVKWCSCYGTVWRFLKKSKIELPCVPAIPPLSIFLKDWKSGSQRDTNTPMFTAVLLTRCGNNVNAHQQMNG